MTRKTRNSFLLLLTAAIWGFAFVAQSTGGDAIGSFSFNCIRSFIGAVFLIPVILFLDAKGLSRKPTTRAERKKLLIAGISCGAALCVATNLQQIGINLGAGAGKSGFLTATYILIVPIFGIFFKRKCGLNIWIGVGIALVGLYLLCINESFRFAIEDLLLLLCALAFSIQIMLVDYFAPKVDGVRLSCIQFLSVGVFSLIPMLFTEIGFTVQSASSWLQAFDSISVWIAILYAGIMSCGIAYTLQIIGQQEVHPTVASLLMSFESVFSVIGGWVILHEHLSVRQLRGCGLIFVAVVLAQINFSDIKQIRKYKNTKKFS